MYVDWVQCCSLTYRVHVHVTCATNISNATEDRNHKASVKLAIVFNKAIAEHTNCSSLYLNYPYHSVQAKAPGARRVASGTQSCALSRFVSGRYGLKRCITAHLYWLGCQSGYF